MQISKKTQYGLRAMIFLARKFKDKKDYSLKEISKSEGVSFDFLEKIMSSLEKKGLVIGKKGAYGGYRLTKSPKSINAGQIVETLEKTTTPVDCFLCGRAKKCASKNVWKKIEMNINKTLKGIKLNDLI